MLRAGSRGTRSLAEQIDREGSFVEGFQAVGAAPLEVPLDLNALISVESAKQVQFEALV